MIKIWAIKSMKCRKHGLRWILAAYKVYIDFITIWWYYNYSGSIACIYPDLTQILAARRGLELFRNHTWLKREMYLSDFFSDARKAMAHKKQVKIECQIGKLHSSMYPLILSFFSCVVTEYGFSTNALKNLKTFALPGANGKQGKSDICYIY